MAILKKISILAEIFEKSRFGSTFSIDLDLGRKFQKLSILVENYGKSWFLSKF